MKWILAAALLTSCSHAALLKPADFGPGDEKESAACELKAEEDGSRTQPAFYSETYNKVFDACMRSKGFKRTP